MRKNLLEYDPREMKELYQEFTKQLDNVNLVKTKENKGKKLISDGKEAKGEIFSSLLVLQWWLEHSRKTVSKKIKKMEKSNREFVRMVKDSERKKRDRLERENESLRTLLKSSVKIIGSKSKKKKSSNQGHL